MYKVNAAGFSPPRFSFVVILYTLYVIRHTYFMQTIDLLLKRYAHIQAPDATLKKACIRVVHEMFGITLTKEDIRVHNGVLRINGPSVLKSELRFNEKEILQKIFAEVGNAKTKPTTII